MSDVKQYDAVIVGSGPGGYAAGIRLGQLGLKAVVIERDQTGGVCLNVGCIPSKALIHAAKTFDKIKHADELGITVAAPTIDWAKTIAWKQTVVGKMTSGVKTLLKGNKCDLIEGEASFVNPREVTVKAKDGTVTKLATKNLIVATGSRPIVIPGFTPDGKRVLDSTGALALTTIPKRMAVIGGGYIGLELGTVYAKLGTKVTIVEALPGILAGIEPDCVKVVAQKLKKTGVEVLLEAKAKGWEEKGDRAVLTLTAKDGSEVKLDTDVILVTVGRRPNTDGANLAALGVKLDPKGFIITDAQQRTNVAGVYAIGDCATGIMLAHKAGKEAEVAAEVIAGKKAAMDAKTIPAVVFTDPEIASAGLTEDQAKAAGRKTKVGKYPFAALGRAQAINDTDGFAKVVIDAETEEILGIHVVGGGASDLISEAALAIEMGAFAHDVGLTVHPHPTLPEALMEAAKASVGEAIHLINR